jgi:hypothetical protein
MGLVSTPDPTDPVLVRRARIARLVTLGQRIGWLAFGGATVVFLVGLALGFPGWAAATVIVALIVGSIVLAPSIVFGYAVKAAEREDREQGR